jgi:acetyltransferase-like isoleucine patch superfamily enzyme
MLAKAVSIISYFRKLSFIDFVRKFINRFYSILSFNIISNFRAFLFFKSPYIILGRNVTLIGQCNSLKLGRQINVYNNCIFELGPDSVLEIGDNVIFSFGCIVNSNRSIRIGNFVQIGEYTSIRDTTHDYSNLGKPMMRNKDLSEAIFIGNNVWIGRNCLICPGSIIEDGVVVGANSIVKGHLKCDRIYAGIPLREINTRQ